MFESDIFLFTSDRQEGWGAVLNEAMASGCVCFANIAAGSTRFLIKQGFNGFSYRNLNQLKKMILEAINNKESLLNISLNATKTILGTWNANVAAENIIGLYTSIKSGIEIQKKYINNGPGTLIVSKTTNKI